MNVFFIDFETTGLNPYHDEMIEFAIKQKDTENFISNIVRPDLFIPELIANGEKEEVILKLTKELASNMYPYADNIDKAIVKDILEEPLLLRAAFQKIYLNNYANNEGVDDFIFVDTSNRFSDYIVASPEEMYDYIDTNPTRFSGPVSLKNISPTTFTNGIT